MALALGRMASLELELVEPVAQVEVGDVVAASVRASAELVATGPGLAVASMMTRHGLKMEVTRRIQLRKLQKRVWGLACQYVCATSSRPVLIATMA